MRCDLAAILRDEPLPVGLALAEEGKRAG